MLEVKNLAVSYGRHRALEGVSVRVDKGEICVILGANGAGKSTLLKAIAGMVHADPGGEVLMNGVRITAMKPHRIVERGVALVPEGRGIFGDLTVAENLRLGAFAGRARRDEAATLDFIYDLFPRLAERRKQVARTMSGGEQQMVAIGRALMSKPEILMLDEPSLGLSPLLTQELFRSLKAIAASGVGILLVEQNAKQSLKIAGRGYLIENGAVTGENSAAALMSDPAVVNAYLGGAGARPATRPKVALPPPMRLPLDVRAMGDLISDLAARAGRIQAAFVRALRQGAELPSAFVGRYDPKAAADPWAQVEAEPIKLSDKPPTIPEDAKRVGDLSAALARRAAERYALHIRTSRLSAPHPFAFVRSSSDYADEAVRILQRAADAAWRQQFPAHAGFDSPQPVTRAAPVPEQELVRSPVPEQPNVPVHDTSIADLAARAAERSAAFVRAKRQTQPPPSAFAGVTAKPERPATARIAAPASTPSRLAKPPRSSKPVPLERLNGSRGLIGHNSGGLELDEMDDTAGATSERGFAIAELAARAASIHAAHVAERRKRLTAFVIPAAPAEPSAGSETRTEKADAKAAKAAKKAANAGKHHSKDTAKKKRKKHKEA